MGEIKDPYTKDAAMIADTAKHLRRRPRVL